MSTPHNENEDGGGKRRSTANGKLLREEKRRKWEAKQRGMKQVHEGSAIQQSIEGKAYAPAVDPMVAEWVRQHSSVATIVTRDSIQKARSTMESFTVGSQRTGNEAKNTRLDINGNVLDSPTHNFLVPYVDIKDKPLSCSGEDGSLFIAEGIETVKVILQQYLARASDPLFSPVELQSIFIKQRLLFEPSMKLAEEIESALKIYQKIPSPSRATNDSIPAQTDKNYLPPQVLISIDQDTMNAVAGFPVTRGVMACGIVPSYLNDEAWLMKYLQYCYESSNSRSLRILAFDDVCDTSNLGTMIRTASAFGVNAVVLSKGCCSAWYRRSVRVSMGHVAKVPVVRVEDLSSTILRISSHRPQEDSGDARIKEDSIGVQCKSFAAVVDDPDGDTLVLEKLPHGAVPHAWILVMGNEGKGISSGVIQSCSNRIRIQMSEGVDSLSVPIATGILLHGLKEREK